MYKSGPWHRGLIAASAFLGLVSYRPLSVLSEQYYEEASSPSFSFLITNTNVGAGDLVPITLIVSTDQAINATSGQITFSPDVVEISSVSIDDSVQTLWIENPTVDLSNGTIDFSGGLPSPGFQGKEGHIFTFILKFKKVGNAMLSLNNMIAMANDGFGTQLQVDTSPLSFNVSDKTTPLPQASRIVGDINGDGKINVVDLSIFLKRMGDKDLSIDLNNDGKVNLVDVSIMLAKVKKQ